MKFIIWQEFKFATLFALDLYLQGIVGFHTE